MHRIHHPGSLNTAIRVRGSWWQGLTALARGIALFLPLTAAQAADTVLEGTEIGILPGNQMEIILKFTGRAPQPNAFSTSGPDRLVVDLPGLKNGLKERTVPLKSSFASSLTAVEASDRTRVVVNLNSAVPYDVRADGNQVRVALNVPSTASAAPPPPAAPQVPAYTPQRPFETTPAATAYQPNAVRDVDFRRGVSGEGRVLISLPSAETTVNVTERGNHVVVDVMNARVPPRLVRRLDVTDFAQIMAYGVMTTPALVIDEKVCLSGRVPASDELDRIISSAKPESSGGCGCGSCCC